MRCAAPLVNPKETKINPMRSTRRKYVPIQWKWFAQTPFRRGPCQKNEIQVTLVKPGFFLALDFRDLRMNGFFLSRWVDHLIRLTWFGSFSRCWLTIRLTDSVAVGFWRFSPLEFLYLSNFYVFVFSFARSSISVSLSRLVSIFHVPPRK